MNKKLMVLLSLMLTLFLTASVLSGCSKKEKEEETTKVEQKVVFNLSTEPDSLDPQLGTSTTSAQTQQQLFEGLLRHDKDGKVGPGVAKDYTISSDGLVYTFNLRKDAKWSDGTPVTAKDFEYAWKRLLDPATASDYANLLSAIVVNGDKYLKNQAKADDLGIKAIDDYTFEVKLVAPAPYLLDLATFPSLYPVKKDVVEKNPKDWATKPETLVGNGPFKMTKWSSNEAIEFVKNPNYWNAKNIKLTKLVFVMNNDEQASLGAYESGEIDFLRTFPISETKRLISTKQVEVLPNLGTYYIRFNTTKKPFNDIRVRKALTLAINSQDIIDAVLMAGQKPATAFVPFGIKDADGKDFRENGGALFTKNVEEAKKLLAEAGYPDGKGFPEVTYLYNTLQGHQRIGEMLQDTWKKTLGINVKLANQEFKVYLKSMDTLNYDLCRAGWNADYSDPTTFLNMFRSFDGNNDTGWKNSKYDDLMAKGNAEADPAKRMNYFHEAEKILIDDMPIGPIYFYTTSVLIKPYVKGIVVNEMLRIYFDYAYVDEKAYTEYKKNNK
ncbi:MAG: peptide ABC transporter substrate-binding protein [Bacillota bacterium]|nr:peptide ABC transporter substrate-binding protein [Bacillota bacterium]